MIMSIVSIISGLLGVVIGGIITNSATLKSAKSSSISSAHTESNMRENVFKILGKHYWNIDDIEYLKNTLNLKYIVGKPDKSSDDYYLENYICSEIQKLSNYWDKKNFCKDRETKGYFYYKDTERLRQLMRMSVKNDWQVLQNKPKEYVSIFDIDKYLSKNR